MAGEATGGIGDLLQNKLFLQYLAGAGADLASYGANTDKGLQLENVNAITNQSIKTNSMNKLMQTILGDNDSKMTLGKDGMTLKIPTAMLSGEGSGLGTVEQPATGAQGAGQQAPAVQPVAPVARPSRPNPFAEANGASLAGISGPEMMELAKMYQSQLQIDQATQKQVEDELYRKTVTTPYTKALTDQAIVTTEAHKPTEKVNIGGVETMVTKQQAVELAKLNELPTDVKLFRFAQTPAGGNFKGSFDEYKNSTTHMKDFKEVQKNPEYGKFLLDLAKAGAVNLGTKVEEKKAMAGLAGQLYFKDPKWTDDIQKLGTAFDKDQAWLIPEKDRPLAKARVLVKGVKDKIEGGGGEIQNAVQSGNTMIWTVKWPSGDVETIKQNIK